MPTDPTTTDPTTGTAAGTNDGWAVLSAALAEEAVIIAGRDDLLVRAAPGAGGGHAACFLPAEATIELDTTRLMPGIDPATVDPSSPSDRGRYPVAYGALIHEAAHAAHSVAFAPDPNTPARVLAAARLLDEARIEGAQVRERPDDRHWLRASTTEIVMAGLSATGPGADDCAVPGPGTARQARVWAVGKAAALVLARVDAGILTDTDTEPVRRMVEASIGVQRLDRLRALWRDALTLADADTEGLLAVGRRWCDVLGIATQPGPDPGSPDPGSPDPGSPDPGSPDPGLPDSGPSSTEYETGDELGESPVDAVRVAVTESGVLIKAAVEAQPLPDAATTVTVSAAGESQAAACQNTAQRVFSDSDKLGRSTQLRGTRPPTRKERSAARVLGAALTTAGTRARARSVLPSALPPGRLRMRGVITAEAQRAAGSIVSAEPFSRTVRRVTPTPPLRVGIACDVSASMRAMARPVASAAWILAHATRHTSVPASSASVIFGEHVRPITHPGLAPDRVTQFACEDGWEEIGTAIEALEGALELSTPTAARLLVIISDGLFPTDVILEVNARAARLRASGCAMLWLTPPMHNPHVFPGVITHVLADPSSTARAIAHAAITALRATP